jgi:TPR repeat protein
MEEGQKRQKSQRTRFKECFKPGVPQSRTPLDIWKHILLNTDPQSLGGMAQTSKPFEEVVRDDIRVNNYPLARRYRKEGQIRLALKCLKSCVNHNHPEATFQLGYSYLVGGWGVHHDANKEKKYLKRAVGLGSEHALILFDSTIECIRYNPRDVIKHFEKSPEDELYQYELGRLFFERYDVDNKELAIKWWTKAAEQGCARAQHALGIHLPDKRWLNKALLQYNSM